MKINLTVKLLRYRNVLPVCSVGVAEVCACQPKSVSFQEQLKGLGALGLIFCYLNQHCKNTPTMCSVSFSSFPLSALTFPIFPRENCETYLLLFLTEEKPELVRGRWDGGVGVGRMFDGTQGNHFQGNSNKKSQPENLPNLYPAN